MNRHATPRHAPAASTLTFLFDSEAALQAANRLQAQADKGMRFCCEHREQLSLAEARRRDALEAARRARCGDDALDDEESSDEAFEAMIETA